MSIEGIIEQTFDYYEDSTFLPTNPEQLDKLVRYAIARLKFSESREKARRILLDIPPEKSVNYLVWALANKKCRYVVKEILLQYGASDITARPLVGALANEKCRYVVKEILLQYGASDITARPLVGALANPFQKDIAKEILLQYGATEATERHLELALNHKMAIVRQAADEILKLYQPKKRMDLITADIPQAKV